MFTEEVPKTPKCAFALSPLLFLADKVSLGCSLVFVRGLACRQAHPASSSNKQHPAQIPSLVGIACQFTKRQNCCHAQRECSSSTCLYMVLSSLSPMFPSDSSIVPAEFGHRLALCCCPPPPPGCKHLLSLAKSNWDTVMYAYALQGFHATRLLTDCLSPFTVIRAR